MAREPLGKRLAKNGKASARDNGPAPLVIRTNTLKTTWDRLKASLEADAPRQSKPPIQPLVLNSSRYIGLASLTAYAKGWFMVQDQAAQLIGLMLGPAGGAKVAPPGGKSTHLAELMENNGSLTAL